MIPRILLFLPGAAQMLLMPAAVHAQGPAERTIPDFAPGFE